MYVGPDVLRILQIEGSRLLRNAGNNMKSQPIVSQNGLPILCDYFIEVVRKHGFMDFSNIFMSIIIIIIINSENT